MMARFRYSVLFCSLLGLVAGSSLFAQDSSNPPAGSPQQHQGRGGNQEGPPPLFGKISAIHTGSFDITRPDGQTVSVKINDQTQFRKDRQPAAFADFKVGDTIMVRGDESPDHTSVSAKYIGARSAGSSAGPANGGPRGPDFASMGTLGKDYVVGEVKAVDAPRLTILRPDNVSQTIELDESTSLRKGRESITMADIQVGDHVMARGAIQNNLFVPKGVMVMSPQQWLRIEEMHSNGGAAPAAGSSAPQSKPSEPPN